MHLQALAREEGGCVREPGCILEGLQARMSMQKETAVAMAIAEGMSEEQKGNAEGDCSQWATSAASVFLM